MASHQVVERLILLDNSDTPKTVLFNNIVAASKEELQHSGIYNLAEDGHYLYQKLIIPTESHSVSNENETMYYENGIVSFVDLDDETEEGEYDIEKDFDTIYELVIKYGFDNCFDYSAEIFSIYDLVKCYLLKEQNRIQNYFKSGCDKNCQNYSNSDVEIDILLSAILVLEDLIEKENYYEAQRILNELHTCNGLCKDYSNKLKGCGCGRN